MNLKDQFLDKKKNITKYLKQKTITTKGWVMGLPKVKKAIYGGTSVVAVGAIVFMLTVLLSPNAYSVQVNGHTVGYVPDEEKFSELVSTVTQQISEEADNAEVSIVEDEVNVNEADVKADEVVSLTDEELKDILVEEDAAKAQGYAITVDGEFVASTATKDGADEVVATIQEQYQGEDESIEVNFLQEVTYDQELTNVESVLTTQEAVTYLTTGYKDIPTVTVKAGETIDQVAANAGITVEQLKAINPTTIVDNTVTEGQELNAYTPSPFVDVQTTKVENVNLPIYPGIEYKKTPDLAKGEAKVVTEAVPGVRVVARQVVKVNGNTVEQTELSSETVTEPTEEVVLVGTGVEVDASEPIDTNDYNSAAVVSGNGTLSRPLSSLNMSSPFGPRWGRMHQGVDFRAPAGTPIYASASGTVTMSGWSGSYGKVVKISHGNGLETLYAHCNSLVVSVGQKVSVGQQVGTVGSTGNSTGNHLHFEVRVNGTPVNPMGYL